MTHHLARRLTDSLRASKRSQSTIEAAIVIPVLFFITLSFVAVQIRLEAQSELDAATSLAAAAAAEAPACSSGCTQSYNTADQTFLATVNQYGYFSSNPTQTYLSGCGPHPVFSNAPISCTGHTQLTWLAIAFTKQTQGMPVVSLAYQLVNISATYQAVPSSYRTQCGYIGGVC